MNEQFRIAPRPQRRGTQAAPEVAVNARQNQYVSALPAADSELQGLVQGLAALNPALAQHAEVNQGIQERAGRLATTEASRAYVQEHQAPREALTGQEIQVPDSVPPAYADVARRTIAEGLSHRFAIETKAGVIAEYDTAKDQPDFNPQQWLAKKRAEALQGVVDKTAIATVGAHFSELEAGMAAEFRRAQAKRRDEVQQSIVSAAAGDTFTADKSPDQLFEAWQKFMEMARGQGRTAKDAAATMFLQLQHASNRAGGSPELFDVFERKDAEGMRLIDRNPQLGPMVDQAKAQARQARDKAILQASEKDNAKTLMGYESDIDTAPERVTMERIVGDMTQYGAVQNPGQAAALWNRAQESLRKKMATASFEADAQGGRLWIHDPKVQGQVLDRLAGGLVQGLAQATTANDPAAVGQVAEQILQLHSRTGATVPVDQLQRYVKTLVTNLPAKEGASPAFLAAAELYMKLSGDPKYRDLYFDEDTSKVLEGYNSATAAGTDPKTAYTQAYQATSPEAKAAAEAFVKTPAFQKLISKDVKTFVEGSSWVPRWMGGNGRPENTSVVGSAVAGEMRAWRARNPFATDEQASAYVETWTRKNWVLDATTNVAVRVPPGLAGQGAQEALTNFSAEMSKSLRMGSRNDGDWSVQYVPTGTEGHFHVVAFNGAASKAIGDVSLETLMANERAKKVLSDDERVQLGRMRGALKGGELLALAPELLAKAEHLKLLRPDEVRAYREASQKQFIDRLQSTPKFTLGNPTADNLQFQPRKSMTIDNRLTAQVALDLMASPMMAAGTQHQSYAASLITMGEAVALKAYEDPAHGAGKNIGMGYNLAANAKNVHEDLKRSGVPVERIDDVINGRASLSPDQAKRLLIVAMPRYERQVSEVAESTSPGLWARMTPAQKAVMVDVAWQVGSTDKFKKAWSAVSKGDMGAFAEETKVFFTDRSGERREDTRRNNLRASMLAGLSHWQATVEKYGSLPGSKLQAQALASN